MSSVVNQRDILLLATVPRVVDVTMGDNVLFPELKGLALSAPSTVFPVSKLGVPFMPSILLTAELTQVTGTVTWSVTSGTAVLRTPVDDLDPGTLDPDPAVTRYVDFATMTTASVTVTATLVEDGITYTDAFTLAKVVDGSDALSGGLTNESHNVASDSAGTNVVFTGAGGTFQVRKGAALLASPDVSFAMLSNPNGLAYAINSATGVYSVSAIGSWPAATRVATITFQATVGTATLDKVFTVTKSNAGVDGAGAIVIDLSNDSHSVPCASDGTSQVFTGANSTVKVYQGTTDLTANWSFATVVSGVSGTFNSVTMPNTVTGVAAPVIVVTGMTADAGTVTVTATRSGYATQTAVFSLARAKGGADGSPAVAYSIIPSVGVVKKSQLGVISPTAITFTGYSATGATVPAVYAGRIGVFTSTNGIAFTQQYLSASNESSTSYNVPAGVSHIRGSLYYYNASTYTLLDSETVPVLLDGIDGDDATSLSLSLTGSTFLFADSAAAASTSPVITLTANLQNVTGTSTFTATAKDSAGAVLGAVPLYSAATGGVATYTANTLYLRPADFVLFPTTTRVEITATLNPLTDAATIYRVNGGAGAVYAEVSNDNFSFTAASDGTVGAPAYTGSGTDIRVKEGATELTYDGVGTAAGTWKVDTAATVSTNITMGTLTDSGTYVTVGAHSGVAAGTDTSSVTYRLVGKTASGASFSITAAQTFSKSKTGAASTVPGASAKTMTLTLDSAVFKADAVNAILTSTVKMTANKQNTTAVITWSTVPAVTLYNAATAGSAVTTGDVVYMRSADFAANTSVVVTATSADAPALVDTATILRVRDGSAAVTVSFSNPNHPIPCDSAGNSPVYTGSGTTIAVYEGSTQRAVTAVVATVVTAGTLTAGTATFSGTPAIATIGAHSAITASKVSVSYLITYTNGAGVTTNTVTDVQTVYKQLAGPAGQRNGIMEVYQWAPAGSPPALPTGTSTFTWASSTFTLPTTPGSWTLLPGASVAGQTLWGTSMRVADLLTTATTTGISWTGGTVYALGAGGSVGLTGQSARVAYVVNTSAAVPGAVTAAVGGGDNPPTSTAGTWSYTATSTLTTDQYMYQVDGLYTAGGNVVWGNPYLSNLKVGKLSALTANLGTVSIDTTGWLATNNIVYGGTGVFLGYSGAAYKFSVGNTASYLRWDGAALTFAGDINSSGQAVFNGSSTSAGGSACISSNTTGTVLLGVYANAGPGGAAFYGVSNQAGNTYGVSGVANDAGSTGVGGSSQFGKGVDGVSTINGVGVRGYAANPSNTSGNNNHGIRGGHVNGCGGLIGAANGFDFYAEGSGTAYGSSTGTSNYGPFTGAHEALVTPQTSLAIGDIVVDVTKAATGGISNTLFIVEASSAPMQKAAIGVMAHQRGLLADGYIPAVFNTDSFESMSAYYALRDDYNVVNINAVGEGQINVCGEGGNLEAGDLIVTSSVAGKGMRQADDLLRSTTVAKCREAVNFDGPSDVRLVACIYLCG